jgi:hypothetical protein
MFRDCVFKVGGPRIDTAWLIKEGQPWHGVAEAGIISLILRSIRGGENVRVWNRIYARVLCWLKLVGRDGKFSTPEYSL